MKHHERVSFNQASEILEHGIAYLAQISGLLLDLGESAPSERVRLLLTSFEADQRALESALKRYVEDADDRVLNTFTQISVELPAELAGPGQPLTTLSLTQWLQQLNRHLAELFSEVAESAGAGDLRTAFTALAQQVEAHERKLSKEYQRFEDL